MLPSILHCARPLPRSLSRSLTHFTLYMDPNSSQPVERAIRTKLTNMLSPDHLEVHNESHMHAVPPGSESHFRVLVVSSKFEGLPLIQRQRLVHEALKEELSGRIHALAIQAKTPQQWSSNPTLDKSPGCMGGSRGDHTVEEKLKVRRE
ncbi:bolA-like protein 1 [Pholidichthys leucotaenia]